MMPKESRKYKQYLWNDQVSMPKSTKYFKRKNQTNSTKNSQVPNFSIDQYLTLENSTNSENSHGNLNQTLNYTTNLESDFADANLECEDETIIHNTNENNYNHLDEQNSFPDLIEALSSDEITKNDLAIAYLSAFFNGHSTQESLSDFIKLSNLTSHIKLPTTFEGLSNLVIGKANNLHFKKTWFCDICIKPFENTDNRLQRSCNVCKSR